MDIVEEYSGHADRVLSDLRDVVGDADQKLLQLQKELDALEQRALNGEDISESDHHEYSESEEEDISDLESSSSTIDDRVLSSLRSSKSDNKHAAKSTKPYEINPVINTAKNKPVKQVPILESELKNADGEPEAKRSKELPSNEKDMQERWGCLRSVLTDTNSGSKSRDDLFQQILHATEKKHTAVPKSKTKTQEKSPLTSLQKPQQAPTPEYNFSYSDLFKKRDSQSHHHSRNIPEAPHENRFLASNYEMKQKERYFQPTHSEPVTSRSDGSDSHRHSHADIEARTENLRLQKLLQDEKKKNNKLSAKVSSLEKDLDELHVKWELRRHEDSTGKIAALVEQIQKAQKLRENAMLERLQVAARDRDEALMRAKAIHMKNQHSQKNDKSNQFKSGDKTIMEIVDKIAGADSARIIEKYGNDLVERMNNLKNAKARITAEEMAAVIEERDDAIAKCHVLRQELQNCIEELNNMKRSQNTSLNTTLKARVLSTQEECEQTHVKLNDAEEEIQMLRIYYSLHKSLTLAQDKELVEKYHNHLGKIREDAVKRANKAKQVEAENHQLHEKLVTMSQDNHNSKTENAKQQQELKYLKEKCNKLERLVKVLRRKIVSQTQASLLNSGPADVAL